jgi:hypothetical protein
VRSLPYLPGTAEELARLKRTFARDMENRDSQQPRLDELAAREAALDKQVGSDEREGRRAGCLLLTFALGMHQIKNGRAEVEELTKTLQEAFLRRAALARDDE